MLRAKVAVSYTFQVPMWRNVFRSSIHDAALRSIRFQNWQQVTRQGVKKAEDESWQTLGRVWVIASSGIESAARCHIQGHRQVVE